MATKALTAFGAVSVIAMFFLFIFFLSSDIDNGPVPHFIDNGLYERALSGDVRAVCSLDTGESNAYFKSGELFVADGSIRFNFEEGDRTGSVLMTEEEDLYIWNDDSLDGVLISSDFAERAGSELYGGTELIDVPFKEYFHNRNREGELRCKESNFNLTVLERPDNINFVLIPKIVSRP